MSSGMWLLLVLLVAGLVGVAVQHYAIRKYRAGFTLRGEEAPQRRRFADPEEEETRRWLEGTDEET